MVSLLGRLTIKDLSGHAKKLATERQTNSKPKVSSKKEIIWLNINNIKTDIK